MSMFRIFGRHKKLNFGSEHNHLSGDPRQFHSVSGDPRQVYTNSLERADNSRRGPQCQLPPTTNFLPYRIALPCIKRKFDAIDS
jgi:hypothetical protein